MISFIHKLIFNHYSRGTYSKANIIVIAIVVGSLNFNIEQIIIMWNNKISTGGLEGSLSYLPQDILRFAMILVFDAPLHEFKVETIL